MGKVISLETYNRQFVEQIANYAAQTSNVESLVQEQSDAERSGGVCAALKGVSAARTIRSPPRNSELCRAVGEISPGQSHARVCVSGRIPDFPEHCFRPLALLGSLVSRAEFRSAYLRPQVRLGTSPFG
jgi:hypothetical protein